MMCDVDGQFIQMAPVDEEHLMTKERNDMSSRTTCQQAIKDYSRTRKLFTFEKNEENAQLVAVVAVLKTVLAVVLHAEELPALA